MASLAQWCLYICFFYGRFTGVINFEFDPKTRLASATRRSTIFAAISHLCMFTVLVTQIFKRHTISSLWSSVNQLHEQVYMVIGGIRISCVLLALCSRWTDRRQFIELFNSFMKLHLFEPEITRLCRKSIVNKVFVATMSETLQIFVVLLGLQNRLTLVMGLSIWALLLLTAIINVIVTQYYMAIAHIRGRYYLLNRDLRSVVAEVQSLQPNHRGVFMTKCCSLADRLEEIATTQSDLQALTERLSRTYQIQVFCMVITYYLNMVGNIYLIFSIHKYKCLSTHTNLIVILLGIAFIVFYYLDCWLNGLNVFGFLDAHEEMTGLLKRRATFPLGLDQRLETVFENFLLNLARNPLKLRFFNMFEIYPGSAFAVGNSMLTHAILLIQYDIQQS
ncbi:hypothetical protein KR018_007009 [Drosophila ironensis]|nr:hypothetical protein KR018_007009 [Drosophila ironensis]